MSVAELPGTSVPNQEVTIYDADLIEERHYWLDRLAGEFPDSFLLPDYPRPLIYLGAIGSLSVEVSEPVYAQLQSLTRKSPFLLYVTLLAAFKVCLFKYSGHKKISVGSPALIGVDPNVLVIIDELDPNASFKTTLAQIRTTLLAAYQRQRYSFSKLIADMKREGTLERSPFFDSVLLLEEIHAPLPELRNDLTLKFSEAGRRLAATVFYNQQLFESESVERFSNHFLRILEQSVERPDVSISKLTLLTVAEREQMLVAWNHTTTAYSTSQLLPQLFEAQVERTPEVCAVSYGDERLTYRELNETANQLAHYLRRLRVGPDVHVGLLLERSPEMIAGILGVLKAGGAYVPLDPQSPPARLVEILEDAQVNVLLTQQRLSGWVQAELEHVLCLDTDKQSWAGESKENIERQMGPENRAYLIYTSGSTGRPKGVMVTHRGMLNYLLWARQTYPVGAGEATLVHTLLSFDLTVTSLFPALISGVRVELVPSLPGVDGLMQLLSIPRLYSLIKLTPSHLQLLNRQVAAGQVVAKCCALIIGGEALTGEMVEPWQRVFPETLLINEYGPTETVVGCCVYEVTPAQPLAAAVPIGRPIANTRLYILDQFGDPVPIGMPGELYIGGDGLAHGYWRRAELTAASFVPDALSGLAGQRLYKTGDRARYLADGQIEYLGRTDAQIKLRGFRVEPGEIEHHLRQFPIIREAAVALKKDQYSQDRLVAYLVLDEGHEALSMRELRGFLWSRLPEYLIPAKIVVCANLPLTPNGKVDWRALPEPDWSQSVYGVEQLTTPTEELLLGIWHEVLNTTQIGLDDSFFGIGGHSLLATQVMSRVQEVWNVELELRTLFEQPTIRALGRWLDERLSQDVQLVSLPALETRVGPAGRALLSYGQQRLWFLEQLTPGGSLYNVQLAIRLHGDLRLEALGWSLNEIVRRHEVLRTRFVLEDDGPVQVVEAAQPLALPLEDVSGLESEPQETAVRETISREAQRGFDLQTGQLIRALVIRLSDDHHVVCLTMHHIVCDGWSTAIFVREVSQLYTAYIRGEASPLPDLPLQYADYAVWQREWLSGERLEAEMDYWRRQLVGAPVRLELPTDRARPAVQTSRGAVTHAIWDAGLVQATRELSQKHGATQFMSLLTVLKILLNRYSGQSDIVVGSPIAARTRRETEGLIGFFINTLALRSQVSGTVSFADLVRHEREVCLGAYAHQEVPFEKLVEELNPERELSHAPIFQVMLTLHNMPIGTLEMADLTFSSVEIPVQGAKYDLTIRLVEVGGALNCSVEYNADLFEEQTIERFTRHYQRLLEAVIAEPQQPVALLPLLDEAERRQLLYDWNCTAADYPQHVCIQHLFEEQARRKPAAVAVKFGDASLTYQELNRRANHLASLLVENGVSPETKVGLLVERSLEMVVGILGILKAGGVYVPLDPLYPRERLSFMAQDARIALMLTQHKLMPAPADQEVPWIAIDRVWPNGTEPVAYDPSSPVNGKNLAYMVYTSGSTGQPKGVMISHYNLVHSTAARDLYYLQPVKSFLLLSSFAFDSSVAGIFWTLTNGGTLVLPSPDFERDLLGLAGLIEAHEVTTLLCLPSLYSLLLQPALVAQLCSLETVIVAGEACGPGLVKRHRKLLPQTRLFNEYGPTEATVWSSVFEVEGVMAGQNVPIGRPIPNSQIYILDERLEVAPVGIRGEIYIGGDGLSRGYQQQPDLTARKFVPHPFSQEAGARLYKSGDVGRFLSDGNIEFLGRVDNQLKLRGYRIELGEIECAIAAYPAIAGAAVISREDEPGNMRLVAYYVVANESVFRQSDLRAYLRDRLPEYMVPSAFVRLDALPLTPNGKLDRHALPKPAMQREELTTNFVAPTDQLEVLISEIWSELLQVKEVGIHDNFFELGGHSFLIIRVHNRLQKKLARTFPLLSIFEHPTIRTLAEFLRSGPAPAAAQEEELPEEWASKRRKALQRQRLAQQSSAGN